MKVPGGVAERPEAERCLAADDVFEPAASLGDVGHRDADVIHAAHTGDGVLVSPGRRHIRRQRRGADGRCRESFASREHASRLRPVVESAVSCVVDHVRTASRREEFAARELH